MWFYKSKNEEELSKNWPIECDCKEECDRLIAEGYKRVYKSEHLFNQEQSIKMDKIIDLLQQILDK